MAGTIHIIGAGLAGLAAAVKLAPSGAKVVVLGAGGSARAVGVALEGAHVTFVARHPDRAGQLPGSVLAWDSAEAFALAFFSAACSVTCR